MMGASSWQLQAIQMPIPRGMCPFKVEQQEIEEAAIGVGCGSDSAAVPGVLVILVSRYTLCDHNSLLSELSEASGCERSKMKHSLMLLPTPRHLESLLDVQL